MNQPPRNLLPQLPRDIAARRFRNRAGIQGSAAALALHWHAQLAPCVARGCEQCGDLARSLEGRAVRYARAAAHAAALLERLTDAVRR